MRVKFPLPDDDQHVSGVGSCCPYHEGGVAVSIMVGDVKII